MSAPGWMTGRRRLLYDAVDRRVSDLQRRAGGEYGHFADVAARLARLRRAVRAVPGSAPEVWDDTIGLLPDELVGTSPDPSLWESAAHTAMTLYAVHAQGGGGVHRRGVSLGLAVRRLAQERSGGAGPDGPVFKRFQALVAATGAESQSNHLRSIVTLLRGAGVELDYARLAVDLRDLADRRSADRVRLAWGRDFHRGDRPATDAVAEIESHDLVETL